ncbi:MULTISPECIES: hypothetical protein [Acidobacteriaceae]|uniref:hypothetical protein n=1 Tax=Acidobacteriaceae TaxID=204434 RepID=UPI00131DE508|nr:MULTISPECIES: hypothetical protein [Acidobacteriaceae]MDW5265428.1 hypothetical protein [Edaphobacter sp.]
MNRTIVACVAVVGLMTGMAYGQSNVGPLKRNVHVGWIESEAHPVPGTPRTVVQADIAAGSGYVFVDDTTNQVMKATVMAPAANPSHAGEHVGIIGVELPANGKTQFYIVQVVLDQKALDQRSQQNTEAQAKAKAEEEADAKQKAVDDASRRIPQMSAEKTFRGWFIWEHKATKVFIEEGTNKRWELIDNRFPLYGNNSGQHMVITAMIDQIMAENPNRPGVLHLVRVNSILNDQTPPPPSSAYTK